MAPVMTRHHRDCEVRPPALPAHHHNCGVPLLQLTTQMFPFPTPPHSFVPVNSPVHVAPTVPTFAGCFPTHPQHAAVAAWRANPPTFGHGTPPPVRRFPGAGQSPLQSIPQHIAPVHMRCSPLQWQPFVDASQQNSPRGVGGDERCTTPKQGQRKRGLDDAPDDDTQGGVAPKGCAACRGQHRAHTCGKPAAARATARGADDKPTADQAGGAPLPAAARPSLLARPAASARVTSGRTETSQGLHVPSTLALRPQPLTC
jgi:hypothetical protein